MVNATANFFSQIGNHGLLTLQKSTLNATAINFGSGTIHGNGTISDNVSSLGTISPAGTLTFGGNLTLLGSSVVIMELTGYGNGVGTNDVINVAENFQYAGKLVVTNTTGFAYAPGQSFQLFNFSTQTGQFSATNLPDLAPIGLAWDTSQLNTSGLLIVYGPVNFTGWQLYYFGCTNCPQAAPGADPLGKGISNYNQDLLGLNPTNAASVWRVTSVVPTGANCVVTWRTGAGTPIGCKRQTASQTAVIIATTSRTSVGRSPSTSPVTASPTILMLAAQQIVPPATTESAWDPDNCRTVSTGRRLFTLPEQSVFPSLFP